MLVAGALPGYEWCMTRSFPQDPGDYCVEWQIADQPGTFIDLTTDVAETEVLLANEGEVKAASGR